MTFELLTDVVVPIGLGLLSAFGATAYTNHLAAKREERNIDDVAEAAIRAYVNALRNYAIYLEEAEIASGYYDPKQAVMDPGSAEKIRAAWVAAQPYFHRLRVAPGEEAATSNSLPDHGEHRMEGSENFGRRADLVRTILDRGLRARN